MKDYNDKYQEALRYLGALERADVFKRTGDVIPHPNIDLLEELVDKATPKKVIKETIYDAYDLNDRSIDFEYEIIKCPNCNFHLVDETERWDFEDWDYCPNCGQKLDWSEENGEI
jgi:DNA-directed RNA polymerase subunit RPC12/RpoP